MKNILNKILTVKSLITLYLTAIFGILVLKGNAIPEQFSDTLKTIIIFYFGTQAAKEKGDRND